MAREGTVAARTENVLIRAGECAVTVLPRFGGKIASIRIRDRELLQEPLASIAPRTHTMGFDQGDASGWDECLPSVAACLAETECGAAEIPDHGDLWRVEWEKLGSGVQRSADIEKNGASVTLIGDCFSLPLQLKRRIEIFETDRGWRLEFDYVLRNTGEHKVPWSWAAHPLFAVQPGDRVVLPASIRSLRVEGSAGGRLGRAGSRIGWPIAKIASGGVADLSVVERADSGIGEKLFAGPLSISENWCDLERPSVGVRIRVTFDPMATPYLGLWICSGGWPERPGPKQLCVAIEPSTAPVDSLAVMGQWSRQLATEESFAWPMKVEIERIER